MWILWNLPLYYIFFLISSIFAKISNDQRLIARSTIKCLNSNFYSIKLCIKNKLLNRIVNNTWWLVRNLTCMLRTKRICNPIIKILKYLSILMFLVEQLVTAKFITKFCLLNNWNDNNAKWKWNGNTLEELDYTTFLFE